MRNEFEKRADISPASLKNLYENMEMKQWAKEVLSEKNYIQFIKSYQFTFWFQLLGIIAGFLIPCTILWVIYQSFEYCLFGAAFGILWMFVWLIVSMLIPPTRIYRKFAKWFRNEHSTLKELDAIFEAKS